MATRADSISIDEIGRALIARAEEEFGKERAQALRGELELMAAQLAKLRATPVEIEDEP
jgi:hypothetical protein